MKAVHTETVFTGVTFQGAHKNAVADSALKVLCKLVFIYNSITVNDIAFCHIHYVCFLQYTRTRLQVGHTVVNFTDGNVIDLLKSLYDLV